VLPARHLSYRIDDLRLDATYLVQVASAALGDTYIVTVSGILINSWLVETRSVAIRVSLCVCVSAGIPCIKKLSVREHISKPDAQISPMFFCTVMMAVVSSVERYSVLHIDNVDGLVIVVLVGAVMILLCIKMLATGPVDLSARRTAVEK